jgi:tRNA (cytidine/uridine-2'-O-)-methyltransferase
VSHIAINATTLPLPPLMTPELALNIVLVEPEIPQNTGSIGRLCVCTGARLHLIRPLGFEITEARVRRAGLDYWQHVPLLIHDNWDAFLTAEQPATLYFASTKGRRTYLDVAYQQGDYLVFGRETKGLDEHYHTRYSEQFVTIPMPGRHARSHNLSNAVAIVVYEAYRQLLHPPHP